MTLLAVEGQVAYPLGEAPRRDQVAGRQGDVGRHVEAVRELQPRLGAHRQLLEQLDPAHGAGHRSGDVAGDQLDGHQLVEHPALEQRIAHARAPAATVLWIEREPRPSPPTDSRMLTEAASWTWATSLPVLSRAAAGCHLGHASSAQGRCDIRPVALPTSMSQRAR